jgi:hypothetical protein
VVVAQPRFHVLQTGFVTLHPLRPKILEQPHIYQ